MDKLYQRESYFPDNNEFVIGSNPKEASQETEKQEEAMQSEIKENTKKESVNFSQTKMDSNAKF